MVIKQNWLIQVDVICGDGLSKGEAQSEARTNIGVVKQLVG